MFLPSQLATIPRGCIWPADRVHVPDPAWPSLSPVWGAYTRIPEASRTAGGNLRYGSCVPTGCTQTAINAEARAGNLITLPDSVALDAYAAVTGFKADDPATDQGTDPLAMFAWWQVNPIAGWKLRKAHAIDPQNEAAFRRAIVDFPGVGVVMALSVEEQNERLVTPIGQAGSWGAHFVCFDTFDGALNEGTSWGEPFYADRSLFGAPAFVVAAWGLDLVRV